MVHHFRQGHNQFASWKLLATGSGLQNRVVIEAQQSYGNVMHPNGLVEVSSGVPTVRYTIWQCHFGQDPPLNRNLFKIALRN
jgi:hypothetical protein